MKVSKNIKINFINKLILKMEKIKKYSLSSLVEIEKYKDYNNINE